MRCKGGEGERECQSGGWKETAVVLMNIGVGTWVVWRRSKGTSHGVSSHRPSGLKVAGCH